MILLLTALAGGLGAAARFLVDTVVARHNPVSIPLGTVVVNVSACFLLGLVAGWTLVRPGGDGVAAVVGVGFLGGYSTFSTASLEGVRLLGEGRPWSALVHGGGMLVVSFLAAVLGLLVAS